MSGGKIGSLCESVLPAGYNRVKGLGAQIQRFLDENLPEPLNRAVNVLYVDDDEIVIAANTPVVANYLRLHQAEMRQQLREGLGLDQRIRFRSLPGSLLHAERPEAPAVNREPRRVAGQAIEALERNARWIEDEGLRAALLELAQTLKHD